MGAGRRQQKNSSPYKKNAIAVRIGLCHCHAMTDIETMIRERGLKKGWIAEQIGVLPGRFSQMIRGAVPIPDDKVRPLAKALRFSIGEVTIAISAMRDSIVKAPRP